VLISEAPLNPKDNKNEIAKIFLETFNVPGLLICSQAILALYSAGATTGVVLDCGEGVCDAVPIYDGFALTNCTTRMDFAGGDVTDNLKQKLRLAGYPMHTSVSL
jgi:centractin